MSFIDLNNSEFDSKSINIFNGGIVGVVGPAILKEVNETDPSKGWELVFEKEGTTKLFLDYMNEEDPEQAKKVKATLVKLKHIMQVFFGKTSKLPLGNNMHELTVQCMNLLKSKIGTAVWIHVNYGNDSYKKGFPIIHRFAPFIELYVPGTPSTLRVDSRYLYERPAIDPTSNESLTGTISEELPI